MKRHRAPSSAGDARSVITEIYSSYKDKRPPLLLQERSSGAAQRLAARLAGSLLPADVACGLLVELHEAADSMPTTSMAEGMRSDVLRGLGFVLEAASQLGDPMPDTVSRLVPFLLLRLLHLHSASASQRRSLEEDRSSSSSSSSGPAAELAEVQRLLEKAFRRFPRVVLACCLQSYRQAGTGRFCEAAVCFMDRQLLSEPSSEGAADDLSCSLPAPATAASFLEGAVAPAGTNGVVMATGAPGSAKSDARDESRSLAASVLRPLPETRAWLRDALAVLCGEGIARGLLAVKLLHAPLSRLLQLVTAQQQQEQPDDTSPDAGAAPEAAAAAAEGSERAAAVAVPEAAGPSRRAASAREDPAEDTPPAAGTTERAATAAAAAAAAASAAATAAAAAAAAAAEPPPVLPTPGIRICRAGPCLHLANLPAAVTEAILMAEVSKSAAVESIHMGTTTAVGLNAGEAYVVFRTTIPDAAVCYESLANSLPFGGRKPLQIEFCPALPPCCASRDMQPSPFVWVSGVQLDAVLGALRSAGLPHSDQVIRVAGQLPGFMLDYSRSADLVQPVLDRLISSLSVPAHMQRPPAGPLGFGQQQGPLVARPGSGSGPAGPSGMWRGGPPGSAAGPQGMYGGGWALGMAGAGGPPGFGFPSSHPHMRPHHGMMMGPLAGQYGMHGQLPYGMMGQMGPGNAAGRHPQQHQQPFLPGSGPSASFHAGSARQHEEDARPLDSAASAGGEESLAGSQRALYGSTSAPPPSAVGPSGTSGFPLSASKAPSSALWQGALAKSGAVLCQLSCIGSAASAGPPSAEAAASGAAAGGQAPDPAGWPDTLDVKLRVELQYVEQVYINTPPAMRALLWLVAAPGDTGDPRSLPEFVQYLAEKSRAGVVKLGLHIGSPHRTLYLVPPSAKVCNTLGAEWPIPPYLQGQAPVLVVAVPA